MMSRRMKVKFGMKFDKQWALWSDVGNAAACSSEGGVGESPDYEDRPRAAVCDAAKMDQCEDG